MKRSLSAHADILTQPIRCPNCNRLSTGEIMTRNGVPTLLIRCPSRNRSRCVKREGRRTSEMCPAHYVALADNKNTTKESN